jgi:hypothetical protein
VICPSLHNPMVSLIHLHYDETLPSFQERGRSKARLAPDARPIGQFLEWDLVKHEN